MPHPRASASPCACVQSSPTVLPVWSKLLVRRRRRGAGFEGMVPRDAARSPGAHPDTAKGVRIAVAIRTPLRHLGADLEASEVAHREACVGEDLGDGQLVVLRVVLLEQCDLLEVRAETAFDDLREGGLGLALFTRDL